jgi:hypothetical protein
MSAMGVGPFPLAPVRSLPRDVPHGFRNVGSTPGRLLFVITPGGLEEYFLAVTKCPPPPNPAQLAELARPFGLTLLPPGA